MQFSDNGITLEISTSGKRLSYSVLNQTEEATKKLKYLGSIRENKNGYSLRINKKPSYNHEAKRFFLRGSDQTKHDKVVKIDFASIQEALDAAESLKTLVSNVKRENKQAEYPTITFDGARCAAGGTAHLRFVFINREIAEHLQLTGSKYYPKKTISIENWEVSEPVSSDNLHYSEHIFQSVDVMNKAVMSQEALLKIEKEIFNQHRVNKKQAIKAITLLKKGFEDAWDNGKEDNAIVAYWRLVTGLRGCDDLYRQKPEKEE